MLHNVNDCCFRSLSDAVLCRRCRIAHSTCNVNQPFVSVEADPIPLTTGPPKDIANAVMRNLYECNANQGMISVTSLCDGNRDCPYGDDEANCGN